MEIVKEYLSNSTIHGLSYIASTKGLTQTVWLCVVSVCVAYAGISIGQSFESWSKNKITTTIETLPITEVPFPKVTVCPPKNTFTNLNYDLMTTENITLNNSTQNAMVEDFIKKVMEWKSSKDEMYNFIEEDNERNMYLGLSVAKVIDDSGAPSSKPFIETSAINGAISTPKFDMYNSALEGFHISLVYDQFNLTNSNLELNVKIEHNLHHSQTLAIDLETQNMNTNPFTVRYSIQQSKDNRNEIVNCIHLSLFGWQQCSKNPNKLEIFLKSPSFDAKDRDELRSTYMKGIKVSWNFSGNATYATRKSSLIETDENYIKMTNIFKMKPKPKDEVWETLKSINTEYMKRDIFGGANCRGKNNCNLNKLKDLENMLNMSEVTTTPNLTENTDKQILELSSYYYRKLLTSLTYETKLWVKAFDEDIRVAPTLNYFLRQVSSMMPASNIYRQIMLDVLHKNLDLTFSDLQQLSLMNTSTINDILGKYPKM